ncbi:MAG: ribonuclease P protein component [Hymenobacteraceae bacterium]|nr:ribonuclease P protein component [Hymenobacteraceae bacterium]
MAAPARFTFRKAERLCSRRLLDGLFRHGTAFNTYPLRFVTWRTGAGIPVTGERSAAAPGRDSAMQVVLSVSKRHFKHAHDRNRIKRLLREAWRQHKPILAARSPTLATQLAGAVAPPWDPLLVAVLYIGKEMPESLEFVSRRLRKGLDRLRAELPTAPPVSPL